MRPLNLASDPFRNERLPVLLSVLLLLFALGTTIPHAVALTRVLPSRLTQGEDEIRAMEAELAQLQQKREALRNLNPTKDQLKQWSLLRQLVDRRVFRWTVLLSRLSAVLPSGLRITSVEPEFADGVVSVRLTASADSRGAETLSKLVETLESRPEFENVVPASFSPEPDGDVWVLTMRYIEPSVEAADAKSGAAKGSPAAESAE